MNVAQMPVIIKKAVSGDIDSYIKLYGAVYKSMYKIAFIALTDEEQAAGAVRLTAINSFGELKRAKITDNGGFVEFMIKQLCNTIRSIYKTEGIKKGSGEISNAPNLTEALTHLSGMERLSLAVSTVCNSDNEHTSQLCGYAKDTVGICLTNAEVQLNSYFSKHLN